MILSQYVFRSGLAPKDLNSVEKIFIALEMGAEIVLPPMASIQAIAVIGNRASIWGDHMLAVCINSPAWDAKAFDEHWDESNPQKVTAHCTVRRQGGNPVKRTFSTADAEKAGLTKKDTPWKGYPKRMLQMRARSWALRDAFPDVLKGLDCAEVVREYINIEATEVREDAQPGGEPSGPAVSRAEDLTKRLSSAPAAIDISATHREAEPAVVEQTEQQPAAEQPAIDIQAEPSPSPESKEQAAEPAKAWGESEIRTQQRTEAEGLIQELLDLKSKQGLSTATTVAC